ncbi:Uncharacterized membrane protein YeiH [Lampropedia hyalina DSM 16112]|jgi:uncharacterized membrane protein YeiH|uniref:Uncharacterized membrane protein YeiH n=1 Tax=Lampropedia hyalina DSM 16112 TaxID=1122156 RepID=A0A1M5D5H0_9BURK|nr:TRIC cation channel family protein [Lampropedia hyalina]SHF62234.1 Uncharacterized membrane protein YeiH [Lampropedia hyalina DSM 16112]
MLYFLDLMGTAVFAFSGILQARRLQMDGFGVLVLAAVTAIGGGTMRDLVLGVQPVFWVTEPQYLLLIVATCVVSLFLVRASSRHFARKLLLWADAVGLATFTAIGVNKALAVGAPPIVAISMGVLTGVGGGVLRDVLAREVPLVLRTEIYATACIAGGVVLTGTLYWGGNHHIATLACIAVTLLIRLAAIQWHWRLPVFGAGDETKPS